MSRSYKKHLIRKDGSGSKWKPFRKNQANRRIRRSPDVPNGNAYRRLYDQWNLCDWVFQYDPAIRYYWRNGERETYGPDPIWRWRMK